MAYLKESDIYKGGEVMVADRERLGQLDPAVRERLNQISSDQWANITLRLTHHAVQKIKRLEWNGNQPDFLPEGKQAADLACEAISSVLTGQRQWNPERVPDLLFFLRRVVDSLVSHLVESPEHLKTQRIQYEELDSLPVASSPNEHQMDPEKRFQIKEIFAQLLVEVQGDYELERLIPHWLQVGFSRTKDIASETGMSMEAVNNALKRLRRMRFRRKDTDSDA